MLCKKFRKDSIEGILRPHNYSLEASYVLFGLTHNFEMINDPFEC